VLFSLRLFLFFLPVPAVQVALPSTPHLIQKAKEFHGPIPARLADIPRLSPKNTSSSIKNKKIHRNRIKGFVDKSEATLFPVF
jgi:hypothetical protein